MREIVLDTETTGLDPAKGHRVVEIGAIELINLIPTGKSFHAYLDPERDMPDEAFRVHGLSGEFLSTQKKFAEVAQELCAFMEDAQLVIHNAEFDVKFLNAEFSRLELPALDMGIVTDTLALARRRHPGAANSLDALCQRYGVDTTRREKHGALLDAQLLAEVYAELMGGRQAAFALAIESKVASRAETPLLRQRPAPLASRLSAEEAAAHRVFVLALGNTPVWRRYLEVQQGSSEQG
jgi:DNA polymerase III subunit epsilon